MPVTFCAQKQETKNPVENICFYVFLHKAKAYAEAAERSRPMAQYRAPPAREGRPRRMVKVLALGIAVLVVLIVFGKVFSIRSIEVQGNHYTTKEEVVASSGIQLGDSIFSVRQDEVAQRVNSNRYLDFVGVWRNYFPASVIITVTEHAPRAKMHWMGMLILIGDNGAVLEQTAQIDLTVTVPEIVGMQVDHVRLGQSVDYAVAGQGEAVEALIAAIDSQGIFDQIEQINIAQPDNLSLMTVSGMQILLGGSDRLDEKLALVRDTLVRIPSYGGFKGATLNVTNPDSADYRMP